MAKQDDELVGCGILILAPIVIILGLVALALLLWLLELVITSCLPCLAYGLSYFACNMIIMFLCAFWVKENEYVENFTTNITIISGIIAIWVAIICACNFIKNFGMGSEYATVISSNFALCKPIIKPLIICGLSSHIAIIATDIINQRKRTYSQDYITATQYVFAAGSIILASIILLNLHSYNALFAHNINILLPLIFSSLTLFVILLKAFLPSFNSTSLYTKGDKLYKQGNYEEALKCYQEAYRCDNTTADYYCYATAMVYYEQGLYTKALASLEEALKDTKNNAEPILLKTIDIYTEQEKLQACLEVFDTLIEISDGNDKKRTKYKNLKRDYKENIDRIKQERKFAQAEELFQKGLLHAKSSNFGKAIEVLQDAIKLNPNNEEYSKTLAEIETLYEEEKTKIEELYNKALSLFNEQQYTSAQNTITHAIGISNKQNLDTTKLNNLKNKISKEISNKKKAQELYELATRAYRAQDFSTASIRIQNALQLEPNNQNFAELLSKIQENINEINAEVNSLFSDCLKRKKAGDYNQALYFINEALKLARNGKLDTTELIKFKDDLTKYANNVPKAEEKFRSALNYHAQNDFEQAIQNIENAIFLTPDNEQYKTKLKEIKAEYQKVLFEANKFYEQAKKFLGRKELDNATLEIEKALACLKDKKYIQLKSDIAKQQYKIESEKTAGKLYTEAQNLYNTNSTDYDKIFDLLNQAINLDPKKAYKDMLNKVRKDRDIIVAEKLYEEAKTCLNNQDFEKGRSSIKEAIKLDPSNSLYIDLKQKIEWEQVETEKRAEAEGYAEYGIDALQDGDFSEAIENFRKALKLQPHNINYQTLLEKAKIGKIDIMTCSKNALLSLDFINEEQARNIIQARNEGIVWYEYQKFVEQFGIKPHLMPEVEAKIEFPLKQANKYGRRLDW